ncbi:Tripartite tricarboxylate transporter family receptor [compost metagenome]
MAESGFPNFDMPSWYGLWAPAGTPQSIVNRVQKEVRLALRDPIVAEKLASISFQSVGSSPDEFGRYASREFNKYKTLISAARIKAD